MKNIFALKNFLKALLFLVGLFLTGWFFMPWKQMGEAVLLSASRHLPASASFAYSTVENTRNGFVVNNLELRNLMGMVDVYFSTLTIVPDIVTSFFGMAPTSQVLFTGAIIGDIAVTPLRKIPGVAPGNGRVVVSVNNQGIFLDNMRSDGELSASGSLLADPSAMKILWADMVMDVKSEAFEENLAIIGAVSGLPLHREGQGRWSLRRARGAGN